MAIAAERDAQFFDGSDDSGEESLSPEQRHKLTQIYINGLEAEINDSALMESVSPEDRHQLVQLYVEGLEASVVFCFCGLRNVDLVGICDDGTFLYAQAARDGGK